MDPFTTAYIEAALWSTTDDDGQPLAATYFETDIAPATREEMEKDCAAFQSAHFETFRHGWTLEQAGHDFWLTRNRHGAGFWDRGYGDGKAGRLLTEAAHSFGTFNLYVGDDGMIYGS